MMIDSMANNRFTELKKYVTTYNSNIDILACPKDPRTAINTCQIKSHRCLTNTTLN